MPRVTSEPRPKPARAWASARGQLVALWLLLALSACATAFLFWQFYSQTAARQVAEGQDVAARGCRAIEERYRFFMTGWTRSSPAVPASALHADLTAVVATALARTPNVEGGIWSRADGSLAYAYPTYEGSGPKTDLPAAELPAIQAANDEARSADATVDRVQPGRSQTLVVHACPLRGALPEMTAWTMTRVYTWSGPAYTRLRWGLALTAFTVIVSTLLLALLLAGWTRRVGALRQALDGPSSPDLRTLAPTGDMDLDRLVAALNAAGARLQETRHKAEAAERLAAVGRLSAGLAHEVRNPLMAMRLKAENALASEDPARARRSLENVLTQVTRLETLLRNLLATTQRMPLALRPGDLRVLLEARAAQHAEIAQARGLARIDVAPGDAVIAAFDEAELARAVDNLLLNAIQASPPGGTVWLSARQEGDRAVVRIQDEGSGVDAAVRPRLFEPFVTTRADGSGLGLAIVREIVQAHGGKVSCLAPDAGAAFEIELPCRPS